MPSSQRHRPGVRVTMAPTRSDASASSTDIQSYLEKQLKRASNLEDQLKKMGPSSGDTEAAQKHRHHLCEVLSDIMMSSPKFAMENDCFHRLWRSCFYNPIKDWRGRVNRDKRKQLMTLKDTEQRFKNFLQEAVTLYDYLINDYLGKLAPPATQSHGEDENTQMQDSQSQASSLAMCDPRIAKPPFDATFAGVVAGLYKLYIYMGDLQRYAESYNKAETYYLNASKLGPGYGNPYNQLAVVNFNRDNYCNSLYWYSRSLLATHEKFSTASGNLERLFITNREKLQEYGRNLKPTVLTEDMLASASSRPGKRFSKEELSLLKEKKNAASKSFLAYFVDLQYDFFLLLKSQGDGKEKLTDLASLREKMNDAVASLRSILQFSAFGDSLLCRLVVICTFSIKHASAALSSIPNDSDNEAMQMPAEFLYMVGTTFANCLENSLTRTLEKAQPGKSIPSVRLLLPLDILLEFVDSLGLLEENYCDKGHQSVCGVFWQSILPVGNSVHQVLDRLFLQSLPATEVGVSLPAVMCLKEYQALKGYYPFPFAISEGVDTTGGLVSTAEAAEVLELNPVSQTQETAGASTVSGANNEETKIKLFRLLELCGKFASPESLAPLAKDGSGSFIMDETNKLLDTGRVLVDDLYAPDDGDVAMESSDDDAGDVVLYQMPENGADQALLVPGSFASQSTKSPPINVGTVSLHHANETESKTNDIICQQNASSQMERVMKAPTQVLPPPGFGLPLGFSTQMQEATLASLHTQFGRGLQSDPSSNPIGISPVMPSFNNHAPRSFSPSTDVQCNPDAAQGSTVAAFPFLFGDLRTTNPFAQRYQPEYQVPPLTGPASFGLLDKDHVEETSLLDSGLLDSIFGEVKTNNPWAAR